MLSRIGGGNSDSAARRASVEFLFQHEPSHVGCYELKSSSTFAFTAASILMSGGQGRLKPSPGSFFVASMPSLLPLAISLVAWSSTSDGGAHAPRVPRSAPSLTESGVARRWFRRDVETDTRVACATPAKTRLWKTPSAGSAGPHAIFNHAQRSRSDLSACPQILARYLPRSCPTQKISSP